MQHDSTYHNVELFRRISKGDEQAFRILYDEYRQELYGVALKFTKSHEQTEEIVQEVFINLWVGRGKLPMVEKPDAYIFKVLYNCVNHFLRRESNRARLLRDAARLHPDSLNTTEEMVDVRQSEALIEKALQQLPPQQKTVYRMSRQHKMNIDEIAATLNISRNTAKIHLVKALRFVRTYLKDVAMVAVLLASFRNATPL